MSVKVLFTSEKRKYEKSRIFTKNKKHFGPIKMLYTVYLLVHFGLPHCALLVRIHITSLRTFELRAKLWEV